MTDIVIDCGKAARLILRASTGDGEFHRIDEIRLDAAGILLAVAEIKPAIPVPLALLTGNGADMAFKSAAVIDADIAALLAAGQRRAAAEREARREDLARRFRNISVDWSQNQPFFGDQLIVKLRGSVSLALEQLLMQFAGPTGANLAARALVELRAEASVAAAQAHLQGAVSLVVRLRADVDATISLGLDDININLPELTLPSFDFRALNLELPSLAGLPARFAGLFGRLDSNVTVNVDVADPLSPPRFVIFFDSTGLRAAIVTQASDPAALKGAINPAILAPLKVTIKDGGADIATITDFKFGAFELGTHIAFAGVAGAPIQIADDGRKLFPLQVDWRGGEVTPSIGAIGTAGQQSPALCALLHVKRLTLSLIEDPTAAILFDAEIALTPSGVQLRSLKILEPYPLDLIVAGADEVRRGLGQLVSFLADVDLLDAKTLAGVADVLKILGRMAAAVGRAAVSLTNAVTTVLTTAAEALGDVLAGAAEMIGQLLADLAKLLPDAPIAIPAKLQIELRLSTDPLALRQVLVSVRRPFDASNPPDPANDTALRALGLSLRISRQWHPAVLIDLSGAPAAYLIARRDEHGGGDVASLGTDLWLESKDEVRAVRDADETGDRPQKRLIEIDIGTPMTAIMLVGIEKGETRFLKKLTDRAGNVISTEPNFRVLEGGLVFEEPQGADLTVDAKFDKDRILPLLGMGEPGKEVAKPDAEPDGPPDSFLDRLKNGLGQVVTITGGTSQFVAAEKTVKLKLGLAVQIAGLRSAFGLDLALNLNTLEAKIEGDDTLVVRGKPVDEKALGLRWVITGEPDANGDIALFNMSFASGEQSLELHKDAKMSLRFEDISSDGSGVVFDVEKFAVGRGGLDLSAKVTKSTVKLAGLDAPFEFTEGRLEIAASRLSQAALTGRGRLPEQLVGEADCKVTLALAQDADGIFLQSGKVELEKIGQPIVCHATRFTVTLSDVGIGFVREDGSYLFYFLLTGSLRFTPKGGEFGDGLLKHLSDVEITLDQVPLTSDARVLARHISFQKAIKPPISFSLFNLFTMQIKGIGYHPSSPKFDGDAAICISGQIDFVELGDIAKPKIDFHGLWIAPPKVGESLPRIRADGLGVDLQLSGAVKVRGTVIAVDPDTRTVEGHELAPAGYTARGFLGEGELEIPGWGNLEATLGFLEVENQKTGERKKAFFFYLQKDKLAVEIPTPIWTFWLREAGFGFGYRYTLAGIKDAEEARSVAQLIRILDEVSKTQGDLAKLPAWKPDVEKDNFTLALRGAFQPYPAAKTWNEKREKTASMPFFFDIVAALRSDMTLLMSARGWLGVNYSTFRSNKDNFRARPGFRGYLYISAPRKELLFRGIADSKGFIGEDWPEAKTGSVLRTALQSVDWTTTLYIRPGLFHYEMGWADQLSVRLVDTETMKVTVRGGMIFRAAEDGLLFGYNVEADAWLRFHGRAGRSVGASIEAELSAHLVARVIAFLAWQFNGSLVYGLASLDAKLKFSVSAWMDVDLGFKSFTLRIGFSFSVQLSAAVELVITDCTVGGQVDARVAVQAFGCTIGVGVGFSFNDGALADARSRVARFLAMSLTNEEAAVLPQAATQSGDTLVNNSAATAPPPAPPPAQVAAPPPDGLKPEIDRTQGAKVIKKTNFWMIMRRQPDGSAIGLLIPRESEDLDTAGSFYASPGPDQAPRDETLARYTFTGVPQLSPVKIWVPGQTGGAAGNFALLTRTSETHCRWNAPVAGAPAEFTLAHFFDECFRSRTVWEQDGERPPQRKTKDYREAAQPRVHGEPDSLDAGLSARDREIARNEAQRARAYLAASDPDDERLYAARSTLMTMFLDQWSTLDAATLAGREDDWAHVSDLGLLFWGDPKDLEALASLKIEKADAPNETGGVAIFNPSKYWFEADDPILAADRSVVTPEGIKLAWDLRLALSDAEDPAASNPEQFLHHYRIERTIEGAGLEPSILLVKPAALMGTARDIVISRQAGDKTIRAVDLIAPDWQFVDGLEESTGVPEALRGALLPSNSPEAGLRAATLWAGLFPDREKIAVTYTVTPVDIAGTDALPRSFVVDVPRPAVPVRAAQGELRILQNVVASGDDPVPDLPKDLTIYLALNDPAWGVVTPPAGFEIARIYRLIAETEDVEPEGSYGTDAATARIRGPVYTGPSGAAWKLDLPESAFAHSTKTAPLRELETVEPDDEERGKYPRWAKFGRTLFADAEIPVFADAQIAKDFYEQLFDSNAPGRVAVRFYLQTIIRIKRIGSSTAAVNHFSDIVALPVEHVLQGPGPSAAARIAAIRPEAFEVAIPMAMPPLAPEQVSARSGFTQFFVPGENGTLQDLLDGKVASIPDPQRQIATEVAFAAQPIWSASPTLGVHAAALAGFDLYELDVDEIAPEVAKQSLTADAAAWRNAKRVAYISEVTGAAAALIPEGNRDWKAWRSHFPSTTARSPRSGGPTGLLPWFSARESTAMPAARFPRMRLLPLAPAQTISDLMQRGAPERVTARFELAADSAVRQTLTRLLGGGTPSDADMLAALPSITLLPSFEIFSRYRRDADPVSQLAHFVAADLTDSASAATAPGSVFGFAPPTDEEGGAAIGGAEVKMPVFSASLLRDLLLRLRWTFALPQGAERVPELVGLWRENPQAFDGLSLVLTGEIGGRQTGASEIALDLSSPVHPLLEETFAELELLRSPQGLTYRGLTVMPQPAPATSAKDMAAFMAATPRETDPYGWSALQRLGLAGTVRIHDPAQDEFLSGNDLVARVGAVFSQCHQRWTDMYGDQFGEPFVDICLKPARDVWLASFDKPQRLEPEAPAVFDLDDDGLAFAQIALRPSVAPAWTYRRCTIDRPATLTGQTAQATIVLTSSESCDLERLSDRQAASLKDDALTATFTADVWPQTFLLRYAGRPEGSPAPLLTANIRWGGVAEDRAIVLTECGAPLIEQTQSPYERFAEITPKDWQKAWLVADSPAQEALEAWQAAAKAALPDIVFPAAEAFADFAAAFVPWTQRYLEFKDASPRDPNDPLACTFSALTDDKPLRIAADGDKWIRMRFVRADRWGSVRAYAVKPVGRYHTLLAGIGIASEKAARGLIVRKGEKDWAFSDGSFLATDAIGFGVAVTYRTEKMEKPLVLGSDMDLAPEAGYAQAVVARHGEEALASSNRTLLARLGVPASLTGFGRSYRHSKWPERIRELHAGEDAKMYPERQARAPGTPMAPEIAGLDGPGLSKAVRAVPAIAAGADIWRIAPQPPQYRLVMTSAARSGAVVSDPVVTIFEDMPRRSLAEREDVLTGAQQPTAKLFRAAGGLRLHVSHGLISYHDITPERSLEWITGGADDVAFWPDPDVIYALSRRRAVAGKTEISEEGEIRLVARADPAADEDLTAAMPVVVRTRGTQFSEGAYETLDRAIAGDTSQFVLTTKYALVEGPIEGEALLLTADTFDWDALDVFAGLAMPFGAIETLHAVEAIITPNEEVTDGAAYLQQLRDTAETARGFGARDWAYRLVEWTGTADTNMSLADLEKGVHDDVGTTFKLNLALRAALGGSFSAGRLDGLVYFRGRSGMSDDEAGDDRWDGVFNDADARRIRGWLARRVLGGYDGFALTAIDARNMRDPGAPSLVARPIKLPDWVEEALAS